MALERQFVVGVKTHFKAIHTETRIGLIDKYTSFFPRILHNH